MNNKKKKKKKKKKKTNDRLKLFSRKMGILKFSENLKRKKKF